MPDLSTQHDTLDFETIKSDYIRVRAFTERLCQPLTAEDCAIQSMPDVSPTRWHLAHTTWFFETFVLSPLDGYRPFDPKFAYLFNSYYNTVGDQFPRLRRGLLSRPGLARVQDYRRHVDERVLELFGREDGLTEEISRVIQIGLHHEQQHQELMLTDIKHVFSCNPLFPVYRDAETNGLAGEGQGGWTEFPEGVYWIGHGHEGFAYDNETPRHRVFLDAFEIGNGPVTCGEYLQFMADGGYERPELWLSLGWHTVGERDWNAPLYWRRGDGGWQQFTLSGLRDVDPRQPVCHVSYFEADAFARWSGARLATEAEWELASDSSPVEGNFADSLLRVNAALQPARGAVGGASPSRMFGDVWEWTASPYVAYPGYQPPEGALGEYNGKFMCNQFVLRGGSCATSSDHIRRTYRNFFPPDARWQFSGIRLARGPHDGE